jgi:hypothetical protein
MTLTGLPTDKNDRVTMIGDILGLSEQMLSDAQAGDWDRLSERESERQRLVWALFAEPLSRYEMQLHNACLARVLEISHALTQLATAQRTALVDEMEQLGRGRAAAAAYGAYQSAPGAGWVIRT